MNSLSLPPGFVLRPLRSSDVEEFVELGLPTCAFMHGRPQVTAETMRKHFVSFVKEHAFDTESSIHVVESPEGKLIAQIWLRETTNRFNGLSEFWIWDITVKAEYQSQGIGRALLRFAKEQAIEAKASELWLLVSSHNGRAARVYGQFGFANGAHLMTLPLNEIPPPEYEIKFNQAVIRPLRSPDLKLLYKLWEDAGLPCRPHGRDREDRLSAHLDSPQIGGWGAFNGEKMIAAALTSNDGRKGWLERVATLPEYRKTGLARAIVAAAMQTLRENGALVIAALIEEENTPSRKLFESLGFVDSPTLCYYSIRDNPEC
jgi:ribosomal protein S18 acetylase RimI-like enzyme